MSLTGVPSARQDHWTPITDALIDFDLTPRQFQLVVTLLSYRWFDTSPIIPSVKTLAGRLRCSVRTVQYAMRGLVTRRLIEVRYTFRPDGGQMSNAYAIGPALAPLLAPLNGDAGAGASRPLHPPVQPLADKGFQRKDTNGTRGSQPGYGRPRGYIQPPPADSCFGCGGPHQSADCPKYGALWANRG